jgi:outer membrane biogenesis lipoprotein LolB
MKKISFKNVKTRHFLYALLAVVLLEGCSAETMSEATVWWSQLIETMTKGELVLIVVFGSYIGSSFAN